MGWGVRVLGLMVGAGAVGLAAHRRNPSTSTSKDGGTPASPPAEGEAEEPQDTRGYRLIDCRDLEVLDADKAMAWAYELGRRSSMSELLAELGGGCPLDQKILKGLSANGGDKLRFMYDLARSALQGHVMEGASPMFANLALAQIRGEASKLGVNVASWPSGVA